MPGSYLRNIIILLSCVYTLNAQDGKIADSLTHILRSESALPDSKKAGLLYEIVRNHSDSDSIIFISDELITLTKDKEELKKQLFQGYYYSGLGFKLKGNIEKALNAFFRSAEVANNINCLSCIAASYLAIGDVYSLSQNSNRAVRYYKDAISLAQELNDSLFIASALLNAGSEYIVLNSYDSALVHFRESYKIFKKTDNDIGIAYALAEMGHVKFKLGNLVTAEKNITDAIRILEEYNDSYALSIYYRYLSTIYKKRDDIISALALAQISLQTAVHSDLLPQQQDAYELLTELFALNGDLDKAFEAQSAYIATRDSINNEETIRKMADLRTEYEVAQKQAEVDLLNKKRQNQRIIVIGLFMVLILTSGIFLVHYTNSRKRKVLNKKLIQRQNELQKRKTELEALNKTKDRFFSIISHDLRGPINVLNGTTLLIRDFLDSKNYDELEELTNNMEYSVKRVQNLLDNLLEWAVSQQGEFPYKPERLDMDEICDNVLNIFIAMAATKSIDITYEIQSNAKYLTADRNSLMTILRNLVSNALKFTEKDGAVNIIAESKGDSYCISVNDNGVGIPQDRKEDLFKLVDNKSTWGTNKEKGLGIGLSLVSEFVKMNKGDITVDSTEGMGTSFKICLPQQPEIKTPKNLKKKPVKQIEETV